MPARSARRGLLWPTVAALVGIAILCSLGTWQVQRLHWKEALIARVNDRLDAAPVPAPGPDTWPALDLGEREYQPVEVTGRFDNAHEIHVVYSLTEPKGPAGGIGFFVMTPFTTTDGWLVYVNRGFVPAAKVDPATRKEGQIDGDATVVGLLRAPARRSWFMPADDNARNQWFSRDPALYAPAQDLPPAKVAPYIIDARFDSDACPAACRRAARPSSASPTATSATPSPGTGWRSRWLRSTGFSHGAASADRSRPNRQA